MTNCPYCGKLTDLKLENCPHCGGNVRAKLGMAKSSPARTERHRNTCPNCAALVQDGDIICVACGTNLLTGQKVAAERQQATQRFSMTVEPWLLAAGAVVALVVVIIVIVAITLSRDPFSRAIQLSEDGRNLEAVEVLTRYLETHEDSERGHFELGKIQWNLEEYRAAATSFERAAKLNTSNKDAVRYALASYAAEGPSARAQQTNLLRVVEGDGSSGAMWQYMRALAHGSGAEWGEFLAQIKVAANEAPLDPRIQLQYGLALAMEGEYDQAQERILRADSDESLTPDVQAALGFVASLRGDYVGAAERLALAVDMNTSVARQALTELGASLAAEGNFKEALAYLERAGRLGGSNEKAQYFASLCRVYFDPDSGEALRDFQLLVNGGGGFSGDAAVQMANIYLNRGDVTEARDYINRAVQSTDVSVPALQTTLGRILAQEGREGEANEAFRRALDSDPEYAATYLEMGLLSVRREDFANGARHLESYLQLASDSISPERQREIEGLVAQLKQALASG